MEQNTREAFVAGKFYPSTENEIRELLQQLGTYSPKKNIEDFSCKEITGAILPHAGYIYSGIHVLPFFELLAKSPSPAESIIILHPLHRPITQEFTSDHRDYWRSPLGKIALDREFIQAMGINTFGNLLDMEHSGEVFLPFIQQYLPVKTKIIPIGFGRQNPEVAKEIAHRVWKAQTETGRKIMLIASSDFSHFVEPELGKRLDQKVIDHILAFDAEGVYTSVCRDNISVCGYGPIMSLLFYSILSGKSTRAMVLSRGNSGERNPALAGKVVDYVSILFYRNGN